MKEITIISTLPSDIFSDYLSGKGYSVSRIHILDLKYEREITNNILLVNINPRLALQVKAQFPSSKVMLVNGGGSEKFTAFITIIYGLEDNDYYYFSSWEEFEKIIFENISKKEKKLQYNPSNNLFEYVGRPFNSGYFSSRVYSDKIDRLIENLIPTSISYLDWLEKWVENVQKIKFYVDFNFFRAQKNKEVEKLTLNFEGPLEIDGIPTLKEGSEISFYIEDEGGEESRENEKNFIDATIKKIEGNTIKISFPKKENTFVFYLFSYFKVKLNYLSHKISRQKDLIFVF